MLKRIAIIGAVIIVVVVGSLAWYVFRPPEQASAPIQAIPLATQSTGSAATSAPATSAPATSEAAATSAPATSEVAATSPAATSAPAATSEGAAATASATIFEIVPAESKASFTIEEVLRGAPTTVVGTTDQVAGQIEINPTDLSAARIGTIQINARTLATDNDFRNRAIKNAILETDANEFITFTPSQITGLPTSGTVGTAATFKVTGDLTIKGVTKPVTFDVTVTPTSASRIEGTATTTIAYRDFELAIPDSPSVDTVADDVRLDLQFVAQPTG